MNLALFTNIPSPHQIPLGKALDAQLANNFNLVCWQHLDTERINLGWGDDSNYPWLIKAWTSKSLYLAALDLIQTADVVVWGYAPLPIINRRVKEGKLTFMYTERLFKRGYFRVLDPRVAKGIYELTKFCNLENYHLLAVGPHCANDFKLLKKFRNRMWRWGYFPELSQSQPKEKPNQLPIILWAGRMLSWKRVDLLLKAIAWARKRGCKPFKVRIIGDGPEKTNLFNLADNLGLLNLCSFEEPMNSLQMNLAMEQADIYILPSDQNEGWGVVVNEAMNHGCCVIGSDQAGSVPWLIEDGVNGYLFTGNSPEVLGQLIVNSLKDIDLSRSLGHKAKKTIVNDWSPIVAANRLITLATSLQQGNNINLFSKGPCSFL